MQDEARYRSARNNLKSRQQVSLLIKQLSIVISLKMNFIYKCTHFSTRYRRVYAAYMT